MMKTPLKRSSKPIKRSPLRRVSVKQAGKNREYDKARAKCLRDADGKCEVGWENCTGVATQCHHRKLRSAGGTNETLVAICRSCHDLLHKNPAEAVRRGWMESGKDAT